VVTGYIFLPGPGPHLSTGLEAPSPAPQQLSATSKRLHDGSLAAARFLYFCPVKPVWCNLGSEIALWKALAFWSEKWPSYLLRIFSFLRMCGTSSNSRGFSEHPPRRL